MKGKIEEILDKLLSEIEKGRSIEDSLKEYPQFSSELEPLLRLTMAIKDLPKPEPAPEVVTSAFLRMVRMTAEEKKKGRRLSLIDIFSSLPVSARAIAVILSVILLGWTTLSFSTRSMPGTPLYPVKRWVEKVHHTFTFDKVKNAELHLVFADRRANELRWFFSRHNKVAGDLLRAMIGEVAEAILCSRSLTQEEERNLLAKTLRVNQSHKILLEDIKAKACSCDTTIIQKAIDLCNEQKCSIERQLNTQFEIMESPCPCHPEK